MVAMAYIILFALIAKFLFSKIGLPGILGMIVTGIALGPSGFDLIEPEIRHLLKEFKTVALIVILIRAGLGISKKTLHRIGAPAIRMSFIPAILEGTTLTFASYFLLDLPIYEAGMLGFIIAAVSPAVVVPTMLELKEGGFGKKKEVPTLVLAGASLDDVFAITIFGVFATLAGGASASWSSLIIGVPLGIFAGAALGVLLGLFLCWYYKKFHIRDTVKMIIFMLVAIIFYGWTENPILKEKLPIAALLGIMAIGFVLLERNNKVANRMATKFNRLWVFSEILLFVYIGSEVRFEAISPTMIGIGLLILLIGLTARSGAVWLSLMGTDLNGKEKLFAVIAYWPKATVQAAMGAVPLTMISEGKLPYTTEAQGQLILTMAVLAIVVTAPLGAIGIKLAGPRLLEQSDVEA